MEKVYEGWLTKSPPDWKKHVSIFKLKKWRRRYFVLYSPPDSCIIPGTCDAQLCYYENESLSKECGRIDLKNCEEIISQLETDDFRNVLALKTVFRNQSRIYYLASDTEEELDRWMDKISYVLNISGDEFIEVNEEEEEVEKKKKVSCKSKPESKTKSVDKPRSKMSGISLRRSSSSTLSKSSTSINLLASKQNRTLPGHSPVFSSSTAGKYQKFTGSQSDGLSQSTACEMASESESPLTRSTNIRSKPSFINKIRQLKAPSRRPSCPLIITQPSLSDESAAASVLRNNAHKQNTMRFQGSSGSSIISFNSDYKTPDISSPTMPPLFYFKKYDAPETSLRIESKLSLFSSPEPPPLPPKIRSSDSGLPDENNALTACPIYDIPVHNYGSYKEDDEDDDEVDPGYIQDRLMELEGMTRFEGICLSVVDEREDEGLENDRCPSLEEQIPENLPPPLPVRRKPCGDSSDSEYDVLPFARRKMAELKEEMANVTRTKVKWDGDDDDDTDDSDNYDIIPSRRMLYDDLEPPPLPERKKLPNADSDLGMSRGDRSSDSVDDVIYDRIASEGRRMSDDDILTDVITTDRPRKKVDDDKLAELSNHLAKNLLLPRNRLLVRMKSKSLENIKEKDMPSDFLAEENRISTMDEDKIFRMTFKTRSFKRKSCDKNQIDESISSIGSSSSPSPETSQPLVVNDSNIY